MLRLKNPKGFTLIEILIGVAIVGQLAILAVPNFLKAGRNMRTNLCIKNKKVLDDAISQWAFEAKKKTGDAVDTTAVLEYIKGSALPVCPIDDTAYTINTVDDSPQVTCPNFDATKHDVTN